MMKKENWNPDQDRYLKSGERELHQFLHSARSNAEVDWKKILSRKERRWAPLQRAAESTGGIRGNILEVGAGDGWCSAAVLRHYSVDAAYIMEIDEAAINSLIPETLSHFGVEDQDITLVLGSFNAIPQTDYFDCIIAMGALHHSENLFVTLRSLWSALKPGGYLFSQEPAMADDTPNEFYSKRNQEVKIFKEGIELRNDQRSDHFYRKCEYLTALHHADFEVTVEELPAAAPTVKTDQSIWQRLFSGGEAPSPPVVKSGLPENIFITARKPLEINRELPVTAWETV